MAETPFEEIPYDSKSEIIIRRGLLLLIGIALLFRLHLLFITNINWDEFLFLSRIYSYLRGELTNPLQTAYVHFFTWLRIVSGNEVDQIIAARLVAYCFSLASVCLIYRIGRIFLDRAAALFAVLCYLSFSFVLEYGDSFRADSFATFFCLASVYLILGSSWQFAPIIAGLAAAAALMVTIKSTFYFPVIGVFSLFYFFQRKRHGTRTMAFIIFVMTLVLGFAVFYMVHRGSIATAAHEQVREFVMSSATKVINFNNLFPRHAYLLRSLIENAAIWITLLLGSLWMLQDCLREERGKCVKKIYPLVFLIPLLVFVFYRNAFPYFYGFILPLPLLSSGFLFEKLMRAKQIRQLISQRLLALGLCLIVFTSLVTHYLSNAKPGTEFQQSTIDLVHQLFPEPVTYIDRCAMISSHRKVGFFMSTWGMENYLAGKRPVFRDIIVKYRPKYLLANIASLNPLIDQKALKSQGHYVLLEEDQAILRDNFVHHWGMLFVAGKQLEFKGTMQHIEFEILIPGIYSLEAKAPIEIDGQMYDPASTLELAKGRHNARRMSSGSDIAILRWGEHLHRPFAPAPLPPLFTSF
jgi:hypothetical protein